MNLDAHHALVTIRLASMEDVPTLEELIRQSVRVLSLPYYTEAEIESGLKYIFGVDTQLILDQTYFVAENIYGLVGCGGWSKRKTLFGGDQSKQNEPDPLLDPKTNAARIRAFYVHPQWSRKGIGRRIIKECEEAALQQGFTKLELLATLPGQPLYSALGYSIVEPAQIKTPDGNTLGGFRMEKRL